MQKHYEYIFDEINQVTFCYIIGYIILSKKIFLGVAFGQILPCLSFPPWLHIQYSLGQILPYPLPFG